MRSRLLKLAAALTLCLAALIVAGCGDDDGGTTSADTEATTTASTPEATTATESTTEAASPDPATCVDAWNNGSNAAGQQELLAVFGDGGKGNVIVGSDEGGCALAAFNENKPTFVVYRQSGGSFEKAGGGPVEQFDQYRLSINPLDVILQPSGEVEPVSK